MPGLREKKKEAVRKNILEAASRVFYTHGYEQASMAEIAKEANTGVGTCYNYFPSKASLFCESVLFIREDLWEQEFERIQEKGTDDPAEIIIELIYFVMESICTIEKPILREFLLGVGEMFFQNSSDLLSFFKMFMERRYQVIETCKAKGLLPEDLDSEEAMTCIFSISIVQIVTYAVQDDMTVRELLDSLHSKIALFFRGKTPNSKLPL